MPISHLKHCHSSRMTKRIRAIVRKYRRRKIYGSLDHLRCEIRILHVKPSSSYDDILDCVLETVSLDSQPQPKYETISYCWGERKGKDQLRLNGAIIDVPASAINVLRRFRLKEKSRVLWIDAICINQNNIKERAEQVSLMTFIHIIMLDLARRG